MVRLALAAVAIVGFTVAPVKAARRMECHVCSIVSIDTPGATPYIFHVKRWDIVKKLTRAGFVATEGANHTRMSHPDGGWTVIGRHGEIPTGVVRKIEKQTGVKLRP